MKIKTTKSRQVATEVGRYPTPDELIQAIEDMRKAAAELFGEDGWSESVSFVMWDHRNPIPDDAAGAYFFARERGE